jgi:hypothetical protein
VALAFRELLEDAGELGAQRARRAGRADAGGDAVDEEGTDESMGG